MSIRKTAVLAVIFVIFYNILLFQTNLGIGTGLLFLAVNLYFFLTREKIKNLHFALFSSSVSVILASLFAFRDNDIIQTVNLVAATFFSLIALYFYKYPGTKPNQIFQFILLPLTVMENFIKTVLGFLKGNIWSTEGFKKDSISFLIRGLIIAVPILAVLLFLLTMADPIFGKFTEDLLSNTRERIIVSVVLFITALGFELSQFLEKIIEKKEESVVSAGKSHELAVIAGSILGLFALFILVQFRYLFLNVDERQLQSIGINSLTYSEYVRKGFFELLIASAIASGVIIYILKYLHHLNASQKQLIQLFSAILTIETGLLLLSALKRLALYADAHGLTRARIFGFIFLLWLTAILIIFLIRIFREMKREQLFFSALAVTLLALLTINIINIDGLIATRYKPTVNREIDYFYITSLSADAKNSWKEVVMDSDRIISQLEKVENISTEDNRKLYWTKATIDQLFFQTDYLMMKYGTSPTSKGWEAEYAKRARKWQSYNLSEYQAYQEVSENRNFYEQITSLKDRLNKIEDRVSFDVRANTPLDRATEPPLLP